MKIPKKEEQHTLASRWLHEISEWQPPRFRRKPPCQLPGQLDLTEAVAAMTPDSSPTATAGDEPPSPLPDANRQEPT